MRDTYLWQRDPEVTGWGRAWRLGKEGAGVGPTLRMPRPLTVAPPPLHALGLFCGRKAGVEDRLRPPDPCAWPRGDI